MNLSSWMILVFLLSAGTSLAADVDVVDWLTGVVRAIRDKYKIDGQFCLAVNIDPNNLDEVLQNDPYSKTLEDMLNGGVVYQGSNVVAAKPAGPVHAEPAVLNRQNLQALMSNSKDHFLLIYSHLSPCGDKCANPNYKYNIIKQIRNNVLPKWKDSSAFVFDTVFNEPKSGGHIDKKDLIEALKQLGNSGLGLHNIFRCYKPQNTRKLQCHSCSSRGRVSEVCVEQKGGNSQETEKSWGERSSGGGATSLKRRRPESPEPRSSRRSQSRGRSSRRSSSRSSRRSRKRIRSRSGSSSRKSGRFYGLM